MKRQVSILTVVVLLLCVGCYRRPDKEKVVFHYPNGRIKDSYWVVNGKKEGAAVHYYEDGGGIHWISNYSKGKKEGVETEFFKNGKASYINYYKNGKPDSVFYKYYGTGVIKEWGHLFNQKVHHDCYTYFPDGSIKSFAFCGLPDTVTYSREYDMMGFPFKEQGRLCIFFIPDSFNRVYRVGDRVRTIIVCAQPPDLTVELFYFTNKNWKKIDYTPNEPYAQSTLLMPYPTNSKYPSDNYKIYRVRAKNIYTDSIEQEYIDSVPFFWVKD